MPEEGRSKKYTVFLNCVVSSEMHNQVSRYAADHHQSNADVVRAALRLFFSQNVTKSTN